jgi:hypothetical protein
MSLKRYNGTEWVVVAGSRPGPTGATGPTGPAGTAATISAGAVTTLAAGSNATVANTGTASAAIFTFGIPRGATGTTGAAGVAGTRGTKTYTAQSVPQNAGLTNLIEGDNFINLSTGVDEFVIRHHGNSRRSCLKSNGIITTKLAIHKLKCKTTVHFHWKACKRKGGRPAATGDYRQF